MAKILNTTLAALTGFFLMFCWIFYLTQTRSLAFFSAACVAVCVVACFVLRYKYPLEQEKRKVKAERLKRAENFFLFNDCDYLAEKILTYKNYQIEKTDKGVFAVKNGETSFVKFAFDFNGFSVQNLADAVKSSKHAKNLIVFCINFDPRVFAAAESANVTLILLDCAKTLWLLDDCGFTPDLPPTKGKPKNLLFYAAFNKRRFWQWLLSAAFMALVGSVSYFPVWSLLWATALFSAALYSLFNKRFNVETNSKF